MQKKRVVFYGRVSTQSEEQISALGNQMTWYEQLLLMNPDWIVVGKYEDAGVTGTSVRKRKGFQQMLEDGIDRQKFDLIVTRETKRFARNTVDALSYVRLLKQHGIEVYFVSDAIHTIEDNDGELRLSIMATIAQEESRKISENVRAGQRISRQKGILRGSGNILGYRRVGKNQYEIDPEQAAVVRKIFQWYIEGAGIRVIKQRLEEEGDKTATGKSHWQFQTIDGVLKNTFYIGRQRQLGQVSDGYLTQKRVKNSPDKIEYIQGSYEPIISEEMFLEAERIRKRRYHAMKMKGKRESVSVWCGKYLCGCGGGTVRRVTSRGEFAFMCYQQHSQGVRKQQGGKIRDNESHGDKVSNENSNENKEVNDICTYRTIMEWKLDMIAYYVINDVWNQDGEAITEALKIIEECYQEEEKLSQSEQKRLKIKLERLEKRKQGLLMMRADGEITKEEYAEKREECDVEIQKLKWMLTQTDEGRTAASDYHETLNGIKAAMDSLFDLSKPKLSREVVEEFVWKMIHVSDNEFELYLHMGNEQFGCIGAEEKVIRYRVFEYPESTREEKIRCTKLKSMKIDYEDAVRYRSMFGKRVLKNKWEDMLIHIYI